ncbi:MAG TPA: anti-sigma factor [Gaiellaceae bacterium]|jgi:anti-sigma-K factor RskA
MDAETLHDLTAAYALDALDPEEREAYEVHLSECGRCRAEVAELSTAAAALAYAVEPGTPPPALRGRILDAARAERPNVIPLRPRWSRPMAAVAAVAACAAVGLAAWNVSLHGRLSNARNSAIERVPVGGSPGSFVVSSGHSASLILYRLAAAPAGKTYEAWVINGKTTSPAGLFHGGATATYFPLTRRVSKGAVVAVTVEPAGGSAQPTTRPFAVSSAV